MAVLIGIAELILLLLLICVLTALALWWYWRRRLAAVRQVSASQHEAELVALRLEHDRQRQADLAAQREAHDRQQQAEIYDMIREFRHQAAHCLRPIKDSLHRLKTETGLQATTDPLAASQFLGDSLGEIEKYEWRLTRLIENMAFVSRLESQERSSRFSEIKLDVIVSDVVSEFQDAAKDKGIRLAWWTRPENLPRLMANEEGLRHVFTNLIDNAINYSQAGDRIDVALEAEDLKNVIRARVADTGPGIPPEDREAVFCKGYTVEGPRGRKPKEGSQGLGLYIAKLVVQQHGGTIDVTGELGKGTTVMLTLPIQRI